VIGRVVQQLNRLTDDIAKRHHALQKLCAPPTAFWAVIHFDLQPRHGDLLTRIQGRPPRFERIDDEITRLIGTAKGDRELAARFIHDAARNVLFFQSQVMITGPVIAPRVAPPGYIA